MNFNHTQEVQSLYIHWPFCPYKCHFCPFVAVAGHEEFMQRYHNALCKEIQSYASMRSGSAPIRTIFFGGGTPSTYPNNLLLDTFGILNSVFVLDKANEITIEVNPGTVTGEKLTLWKEVGINRISIGVQSLNNKVLAGLNRHQKSSDVLTLLQDASKLFDAISVDLIVGLPGVSEQEWKEMVAQVVQWPIKHVSLYFLTVHEDTPLYFGVKQQKIILPEDETVVDLYYWTVEYFARFGLYQYEVSNFARENCQSQHNSVYWQRKPYKGFGLGACSFDGTARLQNEKSLMKYMTALEDNKDITIFYELLTDKQIWLERLMLGLRQSQGLFIDDILEPLTSKQRAEFLAQVELLCQGELLVYSNSFLRLTNKGFSIVNEIIVKLSHI